MLQQAPGGVFEEVENVLEVGIVAIVGVGDEVGGVGGEEVGHAEHLCLDVRRTGGQAGQALHIALVHADDIVETGEVGHGDGTRAVGQAVAAAGGMAYHARVGEFALVVVNQAGAIYGKLGGEAAARHEGAKHLFGGGRAADVAKAYK